MKPVDAYQADTVRHCDLCRLNVYNLSAMTRREAEDLIAQREAFPEGRLCIQMTRRLDGTVVTRDCAPLRRALRLARLAGRRVGWMTTLSMTALVSAACYFVNPLGHTQLADKTRAALGLDALLERFDSRHPPLLGEWDQSAFQGTVAPGQTVTMGDMMPPEPLNGEMGSTSDSSTPTK